MIGKWKKIKTEEIYQCGEWYRIEKDRVLTPGGEEGIYYLVKKDRPSVAIIPIDKDGNLYLTKQHRYGINKFSLELPAGWADKSDKDILASAKRELREETNLISKNWKILGEYTQVIGMSNLKMFIVLAKNCYSGEDYFKQDPLDKKLHENLIVNYEKLKKLISQSKIPDSVTLAAFAIAESQGVFDKYKKINKK